MHELPSLALIWITAFVAHYCADKTKMTPVLWFLALGCLLANIGVLPAHPGVFIETFAELGIIAIMFALGFEENSSHFVASIKRSWGIALFGAIVPFLVTYYVAYYFWHDVGAALMCGLAMTATAVSLTMVSLRSEQLHMSNAATGIMTSAVLDDIASLAMIAVLVPMATGNAPLSLAGFVAIVMKVIIFFTLIVVLAQWVLPLNTGPLRHVPLLNRFNLSKLLTMQKGEHATLTVLLLALLVAMLGHEFGFHPAVGAYMAGLILKEEFFIYQEEQGVPDTSIHRDTRRIVDSVAFSWIGPIFFILLGSNLLLDFTIVRQILPQVLLLTGSLFVGQVLSAAIAARYSGSFSWTESWMIGFGMLGRAELAFVVMDIAYIQHHIISTEMFYTLMLTAFLLNISLPLMIKWWKPRLLQSLAEKP